MGNSSQRLYEALPLVAAACVCSAMCYLNCGCLSGRVWRVGLCPGRHSLSPVWVSTVKS